MSEHDHEHRGAGESQGWRPSLRQIGLGVVILIALVFALSNSQEIKVDYIIGEANSPLWLVIVISIGLGMLIDRGLVVRGRHQDRRREKH